MGSRSYQERKGEGGAGYVVLVDCFFERLEYELRHHHLPEIASDAVAILALRRLAAPGDDCQHLCGAAPHPRRWLEA